VFSVFWQYEVVLLTVQVVKSNQLTPILQCHGDADPLVTHEFGKMASDLISTFNNHLQFKTYRGLTHRYCLQVLLDHIASIASMQPIAIDVAYSCVGHTGDCTKTTETIVSPFGGRLIVSEV